MDSWVSEGTTYHWPQIVKFVASGAWSVKSAMQVTGLSGNAFVKKLQDAAAGGAGKTAFAVTAKSALKRAEVAGLIETGSSAEATRSTTTPPDWGAEEVRKWPKWLKAFVAGCFIVAGAWWTLAEIEKYRMERNKKSILAKPSPSPSPRTTKEGTKPCKEKSDPSIPDDDRVPCGDVPAPYDPNAPIVKPKPRDETLPTDFTAATHWAGAEFGLFKTGAGPTIKDPFQRPREVGHIMIEEADSAKRFARLSVYDYDSAYGIITYDGTYDGIRLSCKAIDFETETFKLEGTFNSTHTRLNYQLLFWDGTNWALEGEYEGVWNDVDRPSAGGKKQLGRVDGLLVRDVFWIKRPDGKPYLCRGPQHDGDSIDSAPFRTRRQACMDAKGRGYTGSYYDCEARSGSRSIDCDKL